MNDILETLRKMLGARADYDIGYWWNAVDLAIDELDKLKRIIEDREAEIERLRGLLREAMSPPVRLRVLPQSADWIRRVREALGE